MILLFKCGHVSHQSSIQLFPLYRDLSENRLGVVMRKHFAGADSMRTLRLAKNDIHQIELDSFSDLHNLVIL